MALLYFVYIIRCGDGSLYTGIAKDTERRFAQHAAGRGARYTKAKGAEALIYREGPYPIKEALRRERAIKTLTRAQKDCLISTGLPYQKGSLNPAKAEEEGKL